MKLVQINESAYRIVDKDIEKAVVADVGDVLADEILNKDKREAEMKKELTPVMDNAKDIINDTAKGEKANEILGEALEEQDKDMIVNDPEIDAVKDNFVPPMADESEEDAMDMPEDFGVASCLNTAIQETWDMVNNLNSYISTFQGMEDGKDYTSIEAILNEIVGNNMINIGQLEKALKMVDPHAELIDAEAAPEEEDVADEEDKEELILK